MTTVEPAPVPTGTPGVLECLRENALGLLSGLDRAPRALRLRAGGVELELEWPDGPGPAVSPGPVVSPGPAAAPAASGGPAEPAAPAGHQVTAQMVGVFYRSPEPGAPPFVGPGDLVAPGQQVGIVEAMKLMTPVEAPEAGRITAVLVADGTAVEYGEPLFSYEPVAG